MLPSDWSDGYANVWLGTTTEDAGRYRMRWPILSRVPADRRFISYEPAIALLGRLDVATARCLPDWVICGGESGGHARVINPAWARHVRDQCRALGVPFLHKAMGHLSQQSVGARARSIVGRGPAPRSTQQRQGGALLDGRLHRQFPGEHVIKVRSRERATTL